jgi:hypothetical protein
MATPSVGFIICIENNKLAPEALLLIASIRNFGGRFSDCCIYTFNPRGLGALEPPSYADLRSYGVVHSDETLNRTYQSYPQANKLFAAAHAEELATEDILVFLDSDSVILNEPAGFWLSEDVMAAATPVWLPGIGSLGPQDPAHAFWHTARRVCGIACEPPYVRTRLTQEDVEFYCNGGLLAARRSARIFSRWLECFEQLSSAAAIRKMLTLDDTGYDPKFFLEQAALAIALMPLAAKVLLLDERYNCPLHNRTLLERAYPKTRFDLDNIIQFHYNSALHEIGFLESFEPPLQAESRQYRWLSSRLPLAPVVPRANSAPFVAAFQERMLRWRESLAQELP